MRNRINKPNTSASVLSKVHDIVRAARNSLKDKELSRKQLVNKSHAVAYSMHSIRTAWLSYYYPYEYLTAVLNSFSSDTDRLSQYLTVARKNEMKLLPPLLNKSLLTFSTDGESILAGLSGIKGVASGAENIIEERKNGEFKNLEDFLVRMSYYKNFTKRTLESLIYAGALDEFEGSRKDKLESLLSMSEYVKDLKDYRKKMDEYKIKKEQYPKLLDEYNNTPKIQGVRKFKPREPKQPKEPTFELIVTNVEMEHLEMLLKEKEYTGMFLTGDPISLFKDVTDISSNVANIKSGKFTISGVITDCERKLSKKGNSFWSFTLENNGELKCLSFKYEGILEKNMIIQVNGNVSVDEFGTTMMVDEIKDLSLLQKLTSNLQPLCLTVDKEMGKRLRTINFKTGKRDIYVNYNDKKILFKSGVSIDLSTAKSIIEIVGTQRISTI